MADQNINNMSVTWSSGGTTFDAIKMNVNDAASAAASNLLLLQVGAADKFKVSKAGVVSSAGAIKPTANDGAALGASGTAWADLFLASGAVINFNAGDVTLTHAANALAFAGASSGYSFDAAVGPSANDAAALGSATVSWADLFMASGAVLNWNNGDVTVTHSANALAFAGASSGYSFDAVAKPSSNDGAALGVSGTAWADLFLASGAVINFNAGDVTITHSANSLAFAGSSGGYSFDAAVTVAVGSVPLVVNSLNNNGPKIALQDSGTIRGYVGASSGVPFAVYSNAALLLASIDASGGLLCADIDVTNSVDAGNSLLAALSCQVGTYSGSGATAGIFLGLGTSQSSRTSTGSVQHWGFVNPNGQVASITTSGSGGAFNISSDGRIKVNRKALAEEINVGELFDAIEPIAYDLLSGATGKPTGERRHGFVAQDIFKVAPLVVTRGSEAGPGEAGFQSWQLALADLMPYVAAEIKSLRHRVAGIERGR